MAARVIEIKNLLPELFRELDALGQMSLTFGYQGSLAGEKYSGGLSVATNAAIQEFGAGRIPKRPFMARTARERKGDIVKVMTKATEEVATLEDDAIDAMTDAAIAIHKMFIETLESTSKWARRNAPSTIKEKGHNVPLLGGESTHRLKENFSWAVRRNGKIIAEGR